MLETWFIGLGKEYKSQVFENEALRNIFWTFEGQMRA
jgi:hypothetical protein